MTLPNIDINMILSDPFLSVGVCLVILGPLLFIFSLIKFVRGKSKPEFVVPHHPIEEDVQPEPTVSLQNGGNQEKKVEVEEETVPVFEQIAEREETVRRSSTNANDASDRTMVMPPYVSDLQAAVEISINQIKQLNKKVAHLEGLVEKMEQSQQIKSDFHELKEPPMDAGDFTKKMLKVVEHVIVLEKEVAQLRGRAGGIASASATPAPTLEFESNQPVPNRPPILPL
jgi:TolA-binding protein